MRRMLYSVTAVVFALVAPAHAQSTLDKPECNQANIASSAGKLVKMKDGPQKQTASTEIETARELFSQGKIEDCRDHLLKASLQTK